MAIKDLFHLSRFPGSSVHPREERPRNRVKRRHEERYDQRSRLTRRRHGDEPQEPPIIDRLCCVQPSSLPLVSLPPPDRLSCRRSFATLTSSSTSFRNRRCRDTSEASEKWRNGSDNERRHVRRKDADNRSKLAGRELTTLSPRSSVTHLVIPSPLGSVPRPKAARRGMERPRVEEKGGE